VSLSQSIQGLKGFNNASSSDQWRTAFSDLSIQSDKALAYISSERATVGSQLNRVSEINSNLRAQSTNLGKSKSDLIGVDYASESRNLGKGFIREYAATSAIKVANEMPSVVKTLMKLWDDIKS
jgi:flagellin